MALSAEQKSLVKDLAYIGLVGTVVSIPIGLWVVPKYRERAWISAAVLTAASYGVKHYMMKDAH